MGQTHCSGSSSHLRRNRKIHEGLAKASPFYFPVVSTRTDASL